MATSLSEDEFQRLQNQLIELRSKNYVLEEKAQKYQNDLTQTYQYIEDLKKELSKAQKTISRSKNARDIDQLIQENDTLQRKLQSQEDEFRLQNETLMQELSSLVSHNEKLKKELELVKTESVPSADLVIQNEVTRLKAENAAIRKSLAVFHERRISPESNVPHKIQGSGAETDDTLTEHEDENLKSKSDLKLKLEIELEEKKILKEEIQKLKRLGKDEMLCLSYENNKLNEKLKKKQEVLLQLQEEKEKIYADFKTLQDYKQNEIQQLKEQIRSMHIQLNLTIQQNEQRKIPLLTEERAQSCGECTTEFIAGQKASFERSLNETKVSLIHSQNELQSLNSQLKDSMTAIRKSEEEKDILQKEKDNLESLLTEKSNLAEKRKKLMDEMNGHLLEITNKHSKEIESLTQQLAEEQDKLQKLFDKEKEARLELQQAKCETQSLKEEVERLQSEKSFVECELKDAHEGTILLNTDYQQQIENCRQEHSITVKNLECVLQSQIKDLTIQVEVVHAEKAEFEEKVVKLQQELKDSLDERKIHEKKGLSMVKDLKRQLQVERKRAEKLQERLQEILSDQNRSVDDILQTGNQTDKAKGDASSVSSWSYVSGGTNDKETRECVLLQSDGSSGGHDSPSRASPTLLENETSNLLAKVTYLQQKNWILEEKVNHLEMSNEALVDDLLKKTAIIQYYCMEGRADAHSPVVQDKLTIKRIVDFIKDKGDENLREINRRMQRMLEETLTKNMHLQKDIETLSDEVSRLSKLSLAPVDAKLQSSVFLEGV